MSALLERIEWLRRWHEGGVNDADRRGESDEAVICGVLADEYGVLLEYAMEQDEVTLDGLDARTVADFIELYAVEFDEYLTEKRRLHQAPVRRSQLVNNLRNRIKVPGGG